MYLVSARLRAADPRTPRDVPHPADVRLSLWDAADPADRLEHVYARHAPPSSVEAVLFLALPTLADAERAADRLLARCTVGGRRLDRWSTVPLTTLVELSAQRADPGEGGPGEGGPV